MAEVEKWRSLAALEKWHRVFDQTVIETGDYEEACRIADGRPRVGTGKDAAEALQKALRGD